MGAFESFANAIVKLKDLLPKKAISSEYLEIIHLAFDFAKAAAEDEMSRRSRYNLKIDSEEIDKLFYKMFNYHVDNQIKMFIACHKP